MSNSVTPVQVEDLERGSGSTLNMSAEYKGLQIIEERLRETLQPDLFEHVMRTTAVAVGIAQTLGMSDESCRIAAMLHDVCRGTSGGDLLNLARKLGLPVDCVEAQRPVLLHGKVGAEIARGDFGVRDPVVLDAIRYHTTGRARMSIVEQILYIADKIEPGKSIPVSLERLTGNPPEDMERIRTFLISHAGWMMDRLAKKEIPVHPRLIEMRDWALRMRVDD